MITPETEVMEGDGTQGPQMMLTPEGGGDGGFQGPGMMFTPEAQAQAQAQLQQGQQFRQQRRAGIAQRFQQVRQNFQNQMPPQGAPAAQTVPAEESLKGDATMNRPQEDVEVGGRFRRASLMPVNYNRFPSAEALEEPE